MLLFSILTDVFICVGILVTKNFVLSSFFTLLVPGTEFIERNLEMRHWFWVCFIAAQIILFYLWLSCWLKLDKSIKAYSDHCLWVRRVLKLW